MSLRPSAVLPKAERLLAPHWPLLVVLFVGMTFVVRAVDDFRGIPGDLGDARFNSVVLEHFYLWAKGANERLWDPGFFYPYKDVLGFSDNHFGSAPVYAVFRFLGFDRMDAFQGWFVVGHISTLLATYISFRILGFSNTAAAFGALVFAFSLNVLAKTGHAQLTYRFGTPLAFSMFWLMLRDARPEKLGWVAIWTSWQFLCSIYLGLFLFMILSAVFIAYIVLAQPKQVWTTIHNFRNLTLRQWTFLALQIVGSAVILLSVLLKYAEVKTLYDFGRNYGDISQMLPRIQSYFMADSSSIWRDFSHSIGEYITYRHEHQMFFGGFALLLCALALLHWRKAAWEENLFRVAIGASAIVFVSTLAVGSTHSVFQLLLLIPGFDSIRAVTRISLVLVLLVAIVAAIGIEGLIRPKWIPTKFAVLLLASLSLVETNSFSPHSTPKSEWKARAEQLRTTLPNPFPEGGILWATSTPFDHFAALYTELDAMIVAQDLGVPTLNGYSGNSPPGYVFPTNCTDPTPRFSQFAPFSQETLLSVKNIQQRIVSAGTVVCSVFSDPQPSTGGIDQSIAPKILMSAEPDELPNFFNVTIRNTSDQALLTNSTGNTAVRLSWRFNASDGSTEANWDPRFDLGFSLAPGAEAQVLVEVERPDSSEDYLEFSLVQDGYFWFHDAGMSIARVHIGASDLQK